jgi:adenosylcobinamide-GDP ribazoletransferase
MRYSVVFYPLVGFCFGLVSLLLFNLLQCFQASIEWTAFLLLAFPCFLTGFLHFDGLLDLSDAIFADRTPGQRLEILKDPHVGSFAVGIGALYLLAKYIGLKSFVNSDTASFILLIIPILSRTAVVFLAAISTYPRVSGVGQFMIGKISPKLGLATFASCLVLVVGSLGFSGRQNHIYTVLALITFLLASTFTMRKLSVKKLGGVTGDVLGASIELNELAMVVLAGIFV